MAGSKINAKLGLSPDFQEFMGCRAATRGDVTKAVWAYIRENDLKSDDGGVRFDSTLKSLLGSSGMDQASDLFGLLKKVGAFQS